MRGMIYILSANRVLFSRTFDTDYRWIYSCSELSEKDFQTMIHDFRDNMGSLLTASTPYLFFREIENGILVYTISKSSRKDSKNRIIYYLSGCFFGEFDACFYRSIIPFLLYYLYNHIDWLDETVYEINEKDEEKHEVCGFDLHRIAEECRGDYKGNCFLKDILSFFESHPQNACIHEGKIIHLSQRTSAGETITQKADAQPTSGLNNAGNSSKQEEMEKKENVQASPRFDSIKALLKLFLE